jgi:hypothetical protein
MNKIRICAMVTEENWAYLQKVAEASGLSASSILRLLMNQFEREHARSKSAFNLLRS